MNIDKISRGVLSLIIVSVMIAPALALEDPYPHSRFVDVSYEMRPEGVIQFGENVWATITLTNFSKEINESKFFSITRRLKVPLAVNSPCSAEKGRSSRRKSTMRSKGAKKLFTVTTSDEKKSCNSFSFIWRSGLSSPSKFG